MVNFRFEEGSLTAFPGRIAQNPFFGAVFVVNLQLSNQAGLIAVKITFTLKAEKTAIPTVTNDGSQSVPALLQQGGKIVHLILNAFTVSSPARIEKIIAKPLPI